MVVNSWLYYNQLQLLQKTVLTGSKLVEDNVFPSEIQVFNAILRKNSGYSV